MIGIVTQVKTELTDGYNAVQVGYRRVKDHKLTKPKMGHLQKAGAIPMCHLQEFRLVSVDGFEANQRLVFDDIFKEGDLVDVAGTTIGKGFQGFFFCLYNFGFLLFFLFFIFCTSFLTYICFKFLKFCSFFLFELCFG